MTVRRMVFGVFFAFWSLIAGLWLLIQSWQGGGGFIVIILGGIFVAYSLTFFLFFFLHWRRTE